MEYIIDANIKPFVPVCPIPKSSSDDGKAIEAVIKILSTKVEVLSDQIEFVLSKL